MSTIAYFDGYAAAYEETLNAGLKITGEASEFFARQRIEETRRALATLRPSLSIEKAVDFGCGTGSSTRLLQTSLSFKKTYGIDLSTVSLSIAAERFRDPALVFQTIERYSPSADANLVFCNGVFHHISPSQRSDSLAYIHRTLAPDGVFVLWENNALNPAVHYIMRSIAFDRDAKMVLPYSAVRLLRRAGFKVARLRFFFVFPRLLATLRRLEPVLSRFPLGAQYQIVAFKS